jgi:hypothetical protein
MRRLTLLLVLLLVGCLEPMELPGPQVSIEPAEPTTDDDLTLVLEELDSEGAGTTWQISWERDGGEVSDLAGETVVPASETDVGEVWTAVVAAILDDIVGPTASASVTILAGPGDDDDVIDDDDSGGPDDDDVVDDDDVTLPEDPTAALGGLCAAPGRSTNDDFVAVTCTGPSPAAVGVSANDNYTVVMGATALVTLPE